MRSCLTFLLVILLSLNATFAAAASYCQHQQESPQAAHFGHHTHQHHGSTDKSSDTGTGGTQIDPDCGFCHLSFSSFVPTLPPMLDVISPPQLVAPPANEFRSAAVEPFDRPPLARLA